MKIYSQDFLRRLREWTKQFDIHLIADEIMTGIGRTGKMLACYHANIEPDFLCLGKGLTSGWLPFSVVLTQQQIYELFYADYAANKSFLHSHTYAGNALAASIALEVLQIFREENLCDYVASISKTLHENMSEIAYETKKLCNIRSIGAITAADVICDNPNRRIGFEISQKAIELGALLRPLGNTLYWLPPLNIDWNMLEQLKRITRDAILSVEW